ncbi:MAG: FixH family protein [Nanoarchaeota archaeon]|nr:FixH family protein [Nanoarchaeota archaeon]
MKNRIILFTIIILLLIPFVNGHALERGPEEKSTELYIVDFITEPIFPVTGKEVHLEINVKDKNNNPLNIYLDVDLELHKGKQTINLNAKESGFGHYDMSYKFSEAGEYEVHLSVNGEELPLEFDLIVDSFGFKGLMQVSVLLIFALILIFLAYKDCKKK